MNDPVEKLDYGIDAPNVLRNLFLFGVACLLLGIFGPPSVHAGNIEFVVRPMFFWTGILLIIEGVLFVVYVRFGKFRHRDRMLNLHSWTGHERVLDVGCGRGLLLAGAAKRIIASNGNGHATGIDVWSNVDMKGNSQAATLKNLELEGIADRCTLVTGAAQDMNFPDGAFDVIVSNLCLHNIFNRAARTKAVQQIARVLAPSGIALISDYKRTGEYTRILRKAGLETRRVWGNPLYTFPPLRIVIARRTK
jgi:SAM-dependent methyltransferase